MRRLLGTTVVLSVLLAACGSPAAPPAPTAASAATPPASTTEAAASAGAAPAEIGGQRTFVIDPAASKASYLASEEFFGGALEKYGIPAGLNDVVGTTQEVAGRLQLNLDDLAAALGENSFTVQMNTFTTDQSLRDQWIRENGPSFNKFPEAKFVANAIEDAPASYSEGQEVSFKLLGDLTIREITQPATFDVTAKITGDTLAGVATTRLKMSDFGIKQLSFANTLTVDDEFGIEVQFTAREE